jgi:phosphotransferase system enzyme I (PtsP)
MERISPITGSRRLLSRLRDVMAEAKASQERLNQIVTIIASDFVAEVCSIYVLRAGETLELFAATGLAVQSIHTTRLRIGEGLIGRIAVQARPLALADVQSHPDFAYRPETGEEIFQSLAGVPILRGGRVTGVLAVQNRTARSYTEEEIETLETTAMVIAELIANSELLSQDELHEVKGLGPLSISIDGIRLNRGMAIGDAVHHKNRIQISKLVSDDPVAEQQRLDQAVAVMHGAIDQMLEAKDVVKGGEHKEILETYRMFAEDAGWLARISEAIINGLTAEAAVEKVRNDTRARFRKQTDRYFRERLHDFDDLAHRLLQHLVGVNKTRKYTKLTTDIILIARNMGPAELLDYDRASLKGLVLEEGSATTHVAIIARALDIPVVGRIEEAIEKIEPGDTIIVDGDNAKVHIRPENNIKEIFVNTLATRAERAASYVSLRNVPSQTKDGISVELHLNAGLLADMQSINETGADGIGLFRTEIPFMNSHNFPDVRRQTRLYERIIEQSAGKPVIFRTLDVGGDKSLPYWDSDQEENPAMGWRAIRVSIDSPTLIRNQLRALIRAAQDRDLSIMFPMVTEISEFDKVRKILNSELERANAKNYKPVRNLRVGTMLEVPALAYQMPALLKRVDFISVGSNDLFQFLFASDRGSPKISERFDSLSPVGLGFLKNIVDQCNATQTPISLCGEMAGRPLDAMALIGIGFRSLSMAPSSIGPVKTMIRSLSVCELKLYLDSIKNIDEHSLREQLHQFSIERGIII